MKLITTVYKYKRAAPWMIGLTALATILFFFFSSAFPSFVSGLVVALLIFLAIYAALRPKSIFSVRSVDDRELVFTPDELIWGTLQMPMDELEKLEIYIYAYDTFKHQNTGFVGRKTFTTEYGDRNTITFVYRGVSYDLIFYLGTFSHYDTLIQIMQRWHEKGIAFSARSAFTDSYIREQEKLLG